MPEKDLFDAGYGKLLTIVEAGGPPATPQELVGTFDNMEKSGALQVGRRVLEHAKYDETLRWAGQTILTLNEQGRVEPPLTTRQIGKITKRLADIPAAPEANVKPADTSKIQTSGRKKS